MRRLFLFSLVGSLLTSGAFLACGNDGGNGGTDGGNNGDGSGGGDGQPPPPPYDGGVPPLPPAVCPTPAKLVDTQTPTTKVGTGDPASCTEAALRAAVTKGGIITFDCGPMEKTIVVTSEMVVPNDKDTTIDGNGKIVLSGGDTSRILALRYSFEKGSPTLTVQRLTFTKGRTTDVPNTTSVDKGGGAIYDLGGNVTAIDCKFVDNHGPVNGQDVSGGAIFAGGVGSLVVVGSAFSGNSCSNGGALGVLGANLTVVNSTLEQNTATGAGGNPGTGGNGGGAVMDGKGKTLTICGAVFRANTGHAYGGAIFRTSYENEATTIDQSLFDGNQIPDQTPSQAGGLYLQGTKITLTNTSIVNNAAKFAGAMVVYEHGTPAPGQIDMTNVTITDNFAHPQTDFTKTGLVGGVNVGDRVTGTWLNVTLAGNSAQFASGIGGASTRLTINNSIISNNAANLYTPLNCNGTSANGANDLQWPAGNKGNNDLDCVTGIQRADPKLGALQQADGGAKVRFPQGGSPAIGLGKSCPATDQLGKPRPANCAAGAVEP